MLMGDDDTIADISPMQLPISPFSFFCIFFLLKRSTSHVINNP